MFLGPKSDPEHEVEAMRAVAPLASAVEGLVRRLLPAHHAHLSARTAPECRVGGSCFAACTINKVKTY